MVCVNDAGGGGLCSGNGVCDSVTNQCVCFSGYHSHGDLMYRPMRQSTADGNHELVTDCALDRALVTQLHVMCLVLGVCAILFMVTNGVRRYFRTRTQAGAASSANDRPRGGGVVSVLSRLSAYPNRLFVLGVLTELGTVAYSTAYLVTINAANANADVHAPGIGHSVRSTVTWMWWSQVVNFLATDLSYQIVHTFLTAGTVHLSHTEREAITPTLLLLKRTLRVTYVFNTIAMGISIWVDHMFAAAGELTDDVQCVVASVTLALFGFAVANDNILTFLFSRRIAAALRAHFYKSHPQSPLRLQSPSSPLPSPGGTGVMIAIAPASARTASSGLNVAASSTPAATSVVGAESAVNAVGAVGAADAAPNTGGHSNPNPNANPNPNPNQHKERTGKSDILEVATQMERYAWFLVPIFLGMPCVLLLGACWPYLRARAAYLFPSCLSMASIALSGTTVLYVPSASAATAPAPSATASRPL